LSTDGGQVIVSWESRGELVHMSWLEKGGPIVSPSNRQGAGTRLLESAFQGDGGVTWLPRPEGVAVNIGFRAADKALPGLDGV
jgi:two-component sensor histidine kinase